MLLHIRADWCTFGGAASELGLQVYDLFPVTMVGGTLCIPPRGGHTNVQYIAETIAKETIDAVVMQPTLLNLLLDEHAGSPGHPLRHVTFWLGSPPVLSVLRLHDIPHRVRASPALDTRSATRFRAYLALSRPFSPARRSLRHVVSSGEKLHTPTADAFVRADGLNATLWNMYGATEAGCTYFAASSGEADRLLGHPEGVPAGVPQCYVDVWIMRSSGDTGSRGDGGVVDTDRPPGGGMVACGGGGGDHRPADPEKDGLTPVPTGEFGEICFGGGGEGFMARGYWNQPAMTAEKFVQTARYGRVYRTGDAGKWQDGQVVVKGRLDRQVKVRGVRIQPEEIEVRVIPHEHGPHCGFRISPLLLCSLLLHSRPHVSVDAHPSPRPSPPATNKPCDKVLFVVARADWWVQPNAARFTSLGAAQAIRRCRRQHAD